MSNRINLSSVQIKTFMESLFVPFSLVLPILVLYILAPNSFQSTWKGRFLYILFLWLFFLELALAGKRIPKNMLGKSKWIRTLVAVVAMAVPIAYAIATVHFGLNQEIIELGKFVGVPYEVHGEGFLQFHWPLSLEYLVFTAFFVISVLLTYGIKGLKRFSVSLFFLGAAGSFYMIDTFYPYGTLTVLQSFAPITASSAVNVLKWMGYNAILIPNAYMGMPVLLAPNFVPLAIGWPCAGVHSLFIYTFVILLFLKDIPFALQKKKIRAAIPKGLRFMAGSKTLSFPMQHVKIQAGIMAAERLIVNVLRMMPVFIIVFVGAVGTFIVNILRIASIVIIGVNVGEEAAMMFHTYYGELYFIAWILLYLFAIIYGPKILTKLWKIRNRA